MNRPDPGNDAARRRGPRLGRRDRRSQPGVDPSSRSEPSEELDRRSPPDEASPTPSRSSGFGVQWLVVAGLIIVAAVVVVWMARRGGLPAPPLEPGPAQATNAPGSGVVGLFVQPDDGWAPILDEIDAARRSIRLEVYLLSDEETIAALERARVRGIDVRVLLEEHPFGGAGDQPEVYARLQRAGIGVRWNNPVFTFAHIKTFVVDDRVALIMNQNLTFSSYTKNREFGITTTHPEDVAEVTAIFEADWARAVEPPPGPLVVSPTDSRSRLLALIGNARRSLDVYAEVVRDREMMNALEGAERRGVRVRLLMSGRAGDDNDADRAELARAGVEVRLLNRLYIHAKVFAVDGERAFVGSQNMTATSLDQNRELGIVVDDPAALARIERTFATDLAAAQPEGGA